MDRSPETNVLERGIPLRELQRANDEQRLTAFVEALPAAVFVINADGKPFYANERSRLLLGIGTAENASSEDLAEIYQAYVAGTDDRYPTERMPLLRALDGTTSMVDDMEIDRDSVRVPLEVHGAPLLNAKGDVASPTSRCTSVISVSPAPVARPLLSFGRMAA